MSIQKIKAIEYIKRHSGNMNSKEYQDEDGYTVIVFPDIDISVLICDPKKWIDLVKYKNDNIETKLLVFVNCKIIGSNIEEGVIDSIKKAQGDLLVENFVTKAKQLEVFKEIIEGKFQDFDFRGLTYKEIIKEIGFERFDKCRSKIKSTKRDLFYDIMENKRDKRRRGIIK